MWLAILPSNATQTQKGEAMENALMVALSSQMSLRREMDVLANNIANINTSGFKGENVLFEQYVAKIEGAPSQADELTFVIDKGLFRNMTEGQIEVTNAPFDLAIVGDGFFTIQTADGEAYSRSGHFGVNDAGQLSTRDGDPVLDANGQPIQINLDNGEITVSGDGLIADANGQIGQLELVRFDNPTAMEKTGAGLYTSEELPIPAEAARIEQGAVERSNVSPVLELTKMIQVMRSYQSASKLMENGDELSRKAIQRLGENR